MGGFTALFLGIYGARESTRVVGRTVERWLGTPKLVGLWVDLCGGLGWLFTAC